MTDVEIFEYLKSLPSIVIYIMTFISIFFVDVFYTMWARKVSQGKAIAAGIYSMLIYVCSITAISIILEVNRYTLFPALIGAFFGTYLTIKFDKKHE